MTRLLIMFCIGISCLNHAKACDACGCAAGNLGIGLMTDYKSNLVRLSYFNTRFHSSPEQDHHMSSDQFSQLDLSFRLAFNALPRFRFIGNLPYGINQRTNGNEISHIKGWSDVRFNVNYVVLNNKLMSENTTIYFEAGGGMSLPSGKYDDQLLQKNLPENFNLGNGSLGYIAQINTVVNFQEFGLLFSTNYQINGETKKGYHFGNQSSNQLTLFKEFLPGRIKLIPNAGLLLEIINSDHYQNNSKVPETGGRGIFLTSALNFKSEKWLAGISYSLPIEQNYSNGVIDAGGRLAAHFSYLF